ncbi:molybdopterin-binding protein [Deltaproteobacteria bacterium OttesenSCG-928-K17]|nr:molybdopterin-binding protein [Deltaproteobacteria bacterium OttesenSCG-928-K17]
MKSVAVKDAVGLVLCHDITEIVPGGKKGPAFRKGQVVRAEDIEHLLRLGKEHLYVWSDQPEGLVHEDDAARRIAKTISGANTSYGEPSEGRINLVSDIQGLLTIDLDLLAAMNDLPDVAVATIPAPREVKAGQELAGTRVIPLCVAEESLIGLESLAAGRRPLIEVLPFASLKVGVVTTGSEVYHGRIKDGFTPVLENKFAAWGSEIIFHTTVPDEPEATAGAIRAALAAGCRMVCVTGGMSVDPDDKTPAAIRQVAGEVVTYGAPVFPGAMFMLAYKGDIPIMGLPGCVMYKAASIFDLVVPRLLAGQRLTRRDFSTMGHGGYCSNCSPCHYPNCTFSLA